MATFSPKEIQLSAINSGNRYQTGDAVDAEAINAPIEASAFAQEKANSAVDTAKSALAIANSAVSTASSSVTIANSAVSTANQSSEKASQAVSKSNEAMSLLSAAKAEMNAALAKADQALAHVNPNADGTFPALTAYPVGSIYMSMNTASPAEIFGGTWEKLENRFLLGSGSSYALGATGGEATHTLTIAELPSHAHNSPPDQAAGLFQGWGKEDFPEERYVAASIKYKNGGNWNTTYVGDNKPHNIMPPYLVVNMWKRIA